MRSYIPFIMVLLGFLIIFAVSGGTFRAAAAFSRKHLPTLREYASDETVARALMILFAANLLGAMLNWQTLSEDTAARGGYVSRGDYGTGDDTADLTVTVDGEQHDVDLTIHSREMTGEEKEKLLNDARQALVETVLSGMNADHIDKNLSLPEKIEGYPVKVSWMTDRPDVMDWDGIISENAPEEGTKVTLTAELVLENEPFEMELPITVYPVKLGAEETFQKEVRKAIDDENDATDETVYLPEMIDGKRAEWSFRNAETGKMLLLTGFLAGVFLIYSKMKKKQLEEDQRNARMVLDYPNIVNKLVLLTSAGMSMRGAFSRIRLDYLKSRAAGGPEKPGYEEIVKTSVEMENGVPEAEAYEHMGRRCKAREYKTFSTLLFQSVTRGGSEMNGILMQEAANAIEERKKRARVLGEEAGTKLLLPMVLMLGIVMVILMVPAFMAFM